MRTSQQQDGGGAEAIALAHLQDHGMTLLDRNFTCRVGEIDLLMRDGDTLVMAEVRYRTSNIEDALHSIGFQKRQRIRRAAMKFLQENPALADHPLRFDVIAISGLLEKPQIVWIADAFQDE
jgi:putative endonuclease